MKKTAFLFLFLAIVPNIWCQSVDFKPKVPRTLNQDISSWAFIGALGLLNADANITHINISQGYGHEYIGPVKFFASDCTLHNVNNIWETSLFILVREGSRNIDQREGRDDQLWENISTVGLYAVDYLALSYWSGLKNAPADTIGEMFLSEIEFITSSLILNLKF